MPDQSTAPHRSFLLAGANWHDRLLATAGALLGIALVAIIGHAPFLSYGALPMIIAPIGASAVLVFAVPASPLAQPWSVVGGNVLSALVGVGVAQLGLPPQWGGALAVAGAITIMSLGRCLHPPGGAAALTAVIGPPAVMAAGFAFPFTVVAINSLTLVACGWLFHRISGHSYPHRAAAHGAAAAVKPVEQGLHRDDIEKALTDMGETFDIAMDDLDLLLSYAEGHALQRRGPL